MRRGPPEPPAVDLEEAVDALDGMAADGSCGFARLERHDAIGHRRVWTLVPGHAARPEPPQLVTALVKAAYALGIPRQALPPAGSSCVTLNRASGATDHLCRAIDDRHGILIKVRICSTIDAHAAQRSRQGGHRIILAATPHPISNRTVSRRGGAASSSSCRTTSASASTCTPAPPSHSGASPAARTSARIRRAFVGEQAA